MSGKDITQEIEDKMYFLTRGENEMTSESEITPQERSEGRDVSESSEQKALDDATLDPRALIEQTGDIHQAEEVQEAFTSLVENTGSEVPPIILPGFQDVSATMLSSSRTGDESITGSLPGDEGGAGGAAAGDASVAAGLGDVGAAAAGDASVAAGLGDAGGAAVGHASAAAGLGDLGGAAAGDASVAAGLGDAGGAAVGDARVAAGLGDAGGAAAGDVQGGFSSLSDTPPITLHGPLGTASQESVLDEAGSINARIAQRGEAAMDNDPPPPPPDMSRVELGTGSEAENETLPRNQRSMDPDPIVIPTTEAVPADQSVEEISEILIPLHVEAEMGEVLDESEEVAETVVDESFGEAEEGWTPPEMYAYVDSTGKVTIVDADGKLIDCPPTITKVMGNNGQEKYLATYQANGKTYSFEVTAYISSLSDLYVGYDENGKLTAFNGQGEKVDSPPVITKFVDDQGVEKYMVYYPGAGSGSGVVLDAYTASLENCYVNYGQDGKVTIVDADGNPLKCQPVTYKFLDDKGVEQITAYYPGAGEAGKVTLSSYTASLENCYVNYGQDGKVTIVDADGNPLKCQPVTYKIVDDKGVEQVTAYYPGAGEAGKVTLSSYTATLQNCYVNYGQDGKVTIVDADGKPLASQPLTYKIMDSKGVEQVIVYYPGAGESGKVTLSSYSTSLQNCYSYIGQDGKVTVVGSDGKPLASQPLTYKIVDSKGVEHIIAYYPGDQTKTTLTGYLPPSSTAKSGSSS
jgi:hypothetical protein